MHPEITIAFVRTGTKYSAEYVEILADMVCRCMPADVPFRIVCFTDQPETVTNVKNIPIPSELHGWWAKLWMFSSDAFSPGERVVYFDLDTVIVGFITDIIAYRGTFAILRDVYRKDGLQSSVMAWRAGDVSHIWDSWEKAGMPEVAGGDQAWIETALVPKPDILQEMFPDRDQAWIETALVPKPDILQEMFPDQFVSYKVHCSSGPPNGARVVFFHGSIKPGDLVGGWVSKFWKIGGLAPVDIELVCNTGFEELDRNVQSALNRFLPIIPTVPQHDETMCIVGGGPSAALFLDELRVRRKNGHTIWALNGSGHWLASHGIIPDGIWIVDGREINRHFVNPSYLNTTYFLASQVSPVLFDALSKNKVVLWHSTNSSASLPSDAPMIGVGSTVGMKALGGAICSGYRFIHLYGFDSSYSDGAHHAYVQRQNDNDDVVEVVAAGRAFLSSPWMLQQVTDLQNVSHELSAIGAEVFVHGDGLFQHVAKHLISQYPAPAVRASEVLKRFPDDYPIVGVEVGVFSGLMSRAMLMARGNLRLFMVDSWEAGCDAYAHPDGAGDWHSQLTQYEQDRFREAAVMSVAFAGSRATIIAKRSVEAAKSFSAGSLDFVFIDADHSYDGCRSDIEAWAPKVKSGGILCGHDYKNDEFPEFGVDRAVDEFVKGTGLRLDLGENFTWFVQIPERQEQAA